MPEFKFDTYDFTTLVEDVEFERESRISAETAPRRHGTVVTEEVVLDAKVIILHGFYSAATEALARAEIDNMDKVLATTSTKKLSFYSGRQLNAYCRRFSPRFVEGTAMTAFRFDAEFYAADPFWYSTTETSTSVEPFQDTNFTQANSGSVYVFPTITISPMGAGIVPAFTFTNVTTGKSFSYSASIASGESLVVDTANFTVKKGGVSVYGNFSGTFLWLNSGDNSLKINKPGSVVAIAFYPRFFQP